MTLILLIVAAALALGALITLAFVVAAIRHEPRAAEPGTWAPSPMAVMVRRLTGLHVRRSEPTADWHDEGW